MRVLILLTWTKHEVSHDMILENRQAFVDFVVFDRFALRREKRAAETPPPSSHRPPGIAPTACLFHVLASLQNSLSR